MDRRQIGQILVAQGTVSEAGLARALGYQRATSHTLRLGSILFTWDLLAEETLLAALSKLHHCPPVPWAELSKASPEALRILTPAFAVRLGAFPYAIDSSGLRVAFRNPSDLAAIDEVSSLSSKRLIPGVATEAALVLAYHRFYGRPVPPHFREVVEKFDRSKIAPAPVRQRGTLAAPVVSAVSGSSSAPSVTAPAAVAISERRAEPGVAGPQPPPASPRVSPAPAAPPAPTPKPERSRSRAAPLEEPGEARNRARIAVDVVDRLLAKFPRVLVLGVGKSAISGWTGRGPGLTPEIVAAIRVPTAEKTVVPEVARSGVPHFGPLRSERLSLALRGMLDRDAPACAVFPIRVLDSVAGILYADRLGEPMPEEDYAILADAAETTAKALSRFLLPDDEKE
jgi:type II secretion system (T2SS) protein E